jgi:hypothetical protein
MLVFANARVQQLLLQRQSSSLESLHRFLRGSSEMAGVTVRLGIEEERDRGFHEAGFDSYIAGTLSLSCGVGYCFAKMYHYLTHGELAKYCNRLYSFKSPYSIYLGETDPHDLGPTSASASTVFPQQTYLCVGRLINGNTLETLLEHLREHQHAVCITCVNQVMVFITIKKNEYNRFIMRQRLGEDRRQDTESDQSAGAGRPSAILQQQCDAANDA